ALEHAHALLPAAMIARKVGRGTMTATFARLFGADPTSLPAETVLAALPTFWTRYHDWTGIEASVHADTAEVVLGGFPGSRDVCVMVGAELERIVELTGAQDVTASHPLCRIDGADACAFQLAWSR
ncbi:MAG TPA: hypothetical protein VLX92_11220, partial [Kofleriaceae bacterium]|nr:hypothetical protein [Kofleriaceae bacterium]